MQKPAPEPEIKAWLAGLGVDVPRGVTTGDPGSVDGLTPPLVLKAFGAGLVHKSDMGAVALGLGSPQEAGTAAEKMMAALAAHGVTPDGFLVEEQAPTGVEVIVGVVDDPSFGPVIMTGLGGVFTEVLRDTAVRLCPISADDARAMLASLRSSQLLYGYRGRPPVDAEALIRVLVAVGGPDGIHSRLEPGAEFELNPVIVTPDGAVAVDARLIASGRPPARSQREGLDDFSRLFEPHRVAVVGASTKRPGFGNMFLDFYKATGVPLVAVHPEAPEINGVPAVPSLADADADYALIAVPAAGCADVVRQARGVPFVQVVSGGFREAGRQDLEDELVEAAREAGTRLLGPNCMGVYSPKGGQTFIGGEQGPSGDVALISQSGGMAGEVIKVGEHRGLAFSRVATLGNSADVTPAELLRWLASDPETSVVGLYLENPRDGRALFAALRDVRLPTALLVGGRSGQGQRAAASHTGGMISDTRIWQALAEQTGTALVTSQDDLIGVLSYFRHHAHRNCIGEGVLIIGPSGGASVLAADVFDTAGLELGALSAQIHPAVRELGLGAGTSLANPLEIPVGPRGRPSLIQETLSAILSRQPYPDVVAHVNVQSFFTYGSRPEPLFAYAECLAAAQNDHPETRVSLVTRNSECAPPGVDAEVRRLATGVPVYRSMEAAAVAVAAGKLIARSR